MKVKQFHIEKVRSVKMYHRYSRFAALHFRKWNSIRKANFQTLCGPCFSYDFLLPTLLVRLGKAFVLP